jgi:tRNA pseudouridine13 synthase
MTLAMPLDALPRPLPLACADLPGTGGASKVDPEDFVVEEVPAYEASGAGEHLYLWVEKRGLSTMEAVRALSKAFGVHEREIGYAGQKDRHAVTRQWISIHTKSESATIDDGRLKVVATSRHGNKLRLGHLKGNRFTLTMRGTGADSLQRARDVLARLEHTGLPNFYGLQRFGRRGDNALLGAAVLGLAEHPELPRAKRDHHLRRLALSALQSELFNRCLAERMQDGLLDDVVPGDVLRKRASGGLFNVEDLATERARVKSGELDPTGPMPGPKERPAARDEALAREDRVLAAAGIPREAFAKAGGEAEGARRPYRVVVGGAGVESGGPDALRLTFSLPSGSYATRVLAEVMRTDVALPGEG